MTRNGRSVPLSLSSNQRTSTSWVFQLDSLAPRSIPTDVRPAFEAGSASSGPRRHERKCNHIPKSQDRQVSEGVRRHWLGHHLSRPFPRDRWLVLDAQVVTVQFHRDRPAAADHMRGGEDQRLSIQRCDDSAGSLRASASDQHGRPKSPVVRLDNRNMRTILGTRRSSGGSLCLAGRRCLTSWPEIVTQAESFSPAENEGKPDRQQGAEATHFPTDRPVGSAHDVSRSPSCPVQPLKKKPHDQNGPICKGIRVSRVETRRYANHRAYVRSGSSARTLEGIEFNDLQARATPRPELRIQTPTSIISRIFESAKDYLAGPTMK